MPNIGGPRNSRKLMISCVVAPILLYAAAIWKDALDTEAYRRPMVSVYRRSALRVMSAFRTVLYEAACVVARMPPIELIADERRRSYNSANNNKKKMTTSLEYDIQWKVKAQAGA
nr:uncharacterized protein LOC106682700 [Halyomorpha halys]